MNIMKVMIKGTEINLTSITINYLDASNHKQFNNAILELILKINLTIKNQYNIDVSDDHIILGLNNTNPLLELHRDFTGFSFRGGNFCDRVIRYVISKILKSR